MISGLARCILVVEAGARSGTLITVNTALLQGRDVLVVPGPITSTTSVGCKRLLQQGAKPALGLRDVLEEYDMGYKDAPSVSLPSDLTDAEQRVLVLLEVETKHVDDIATGLDVSPAETLAVLTSLEIRGLVTQEPGKVFRRALDMVGAGAALPF